MLRRYLVGVLALLLLGAAQAHAQQATLAWKLKEGDKLFVELNDSEKFSIAMLGQDMKSEQTTVATLTVDKKNADGLVISQKIDSIKAQGAGLAAGFLDKILKEVEGSVIKVTLDKDYQVQKVEGIDDLMKKVSENAQLPPQFAPFAKTFVTGLVVKPTERVFGFKLPEKAVSKGDKWSQKLAAPLGPLGKSSLVNNYVYEGGDGGKEKITFTSDIKFSPTDNKDGAMPFSIKKADLKTDKAQGTVLFDNNTGRLASSDSTLNLKGSMTIGANNMEIALEIALEMTNKTKLLDKAP